MSDKPTCEELIEEEGYESVNREADDSWRHGSYITEVFKSNTDGRYWMAAYELSTDGETHGLRDDYADIYEVHPTEVTTVVYKRVEGKALQDNEKGEGK